MTSFRSPASLSLARVVVPVCLVLVAVGLLLTTSRLEGYQPDPFPLVQTRSFHPAVAAVGPPGPEEVQLDVPVPIEVTLERGQTLGRLLLELGFEPTEARTAIAAVSEHLDVRRIRAGDPVSVFYPPPSAGAVDRPTALELLKANEGRVRLAVREDGSWEGSWQPFTRVQRLRAATGSVSSSLVGAVREAGADAVLAYRMADVLRWDIDFHRDLREGDRFEVLYEDIVVDGRTREVGEVLALVYDNRGVRHEAYRFGPDGGYYDGDGRPLEKMFLRSPLPFSRITSRFSHRRFHPVLKTYRPHYGVDYGAPVGTPVKVTAHGSVTFVGWNRGGGKTVKVRHANGYLTAYLHLSSFARGLSAGDRVRQGQVIGHVGSTGLSTGPHLDYRVQHHGRWINPLGLDNEKAEPIPASERSRFLAWRDALRQSLDTGAALPAAEVDAALRLASRPGAGEDVDGSAPAPSVTVGR